MYRNGDHGKRKMSYNDPVHDRIDMGILTIRYTMNVFHHRFFADTFGTPKFIGTVPNYIIGGSTIVLYIFHLLPPLCSCAYHITGSCVASK
jgi:hypothetical protein